MNKGSEKSQCLDFCTADFLNFFAYKSAVKKPKHCLTWDFSLTTYLCLRNFFRAAKSPPKPVSAPAAHSLLKDAAPLSNYVPPDLNINAPFQQQQQQQQQRSSSTGMAQHFSQSSTTKTTRMMSSSSQQKEVHTVDARSEPMP